MPILDSFRRCVPRRTGLRRKLTQLYFGVKMSDSFKSQEVPSQLRNLLVYIAREGVTSTNLFRRPGSDVDIKSLIRDLEAGRPICWTEFSFYTLANLAKRYLLHIDGGIFGLTFEEQLMSTLNIPDDQTRIEAMHSVIIAQPKPVQHLLALLFGIWFRMIYHTEVNAMSVEAVAKSVAGSVFPNCTTSPQKVEQASKVMAHLITGFASADLFSRELIEYFTSVTKTSISRVEKFKYEFRFPPDVPREKSVRLFMRMLLEEGNKYGFHLINNAVSKEVFDATNWETFCTPGAKIRCLTSSEHHIAGDGKTGATTDSDRDTSMDNVKSSLEANDSGGGTWLSTSALPLHEQMREPGGTGESELTSLNVTGEPVHQWSEKRTCIMSLPPGTYPRMARDDGGSQFDVLVDDNLGTRSTQPGYKPSADRQQQQQQQLTCFNSVKRRQLERLQKRSDWFLSPPSGMRSAGLIHITPQSSVLLPTDSPVCLLWQDDDVAQGGADDDSNGYDGELDGTFPGKHRQLVGSTPVPSARNGDNQRRTKGNPPAPCVRRQPLRDEQNSSNVLANLNGEQMAGHFGDFARKDGDYPEVETRYYILERYYGPDQRPPTLPRLQTLQNNQLEHFSAATSTATPSTTTATLTSCS